MKARAIFGAVLLAFCLVELWMFRGQQQQLGDLRAAQQQLIALHSSNAEIPARPDHSAPNTVASPELLRLRGQVTRLEQRRRELASIPAQNASLRTQLASRGTNTVSGVPLPPGFVRVSEARFVGYGSPADTIQSFLWAVHNHDGARLLQAFSPEMAKQFPAGDDMEQAFQDAGVSIVGMGIVESRQMADGSVQAKVQLSPDMDPEPTLFRQTNGEWKIFGPIDKVEQ